MGAVTDLPIRESTNPRAMDPPDRVELKMPSLLQWVKAGMGFTVGAIVVTVVAWVLWAVVFLGGMAVIGAALSRQAARQPAATLAPVRR